MNLKILILPGDGIGTEVTRAAVRVLRRRGQEIRNHTLNLSEGLLGGIAIHKTGTPVPAGNRATQPLAADATLMGAVGLPGVRQRTAREAPRKRPARNSQGAGRLRQSAPGAHVPGAARFFAAQEPSGGRHRHDHRPRADRRPLLRHAARHLRRRRGDAGGQHHDLHARRNRARRPHGFPPGARRAARRSPPSTSRTCWRIRSSGAKWSSKWRKQYPDVELDHLLVDNCAMQLVLNPQPLRHHADRKHVRRYPERRRRGAGRLHRHAALGFLGDQKPPAPGSGCTSRCTARRPTSPARTRPIHSAPSARWPPCSNTVSADEGSRGGETRHRKGSRIAAT